MDLRESCPASGATVDALASALLALLDIAETKGDLSETDFYRLKAALEGRADA